MNDEGAALHRTPAHRDELYGESCETEASKRSGKQGKQQKERCSGHPWTDPKCGSDRFEPETDGENEFMKGPKEGENSIQACFMRLMHCCVSANYKRFLGIGIHPGQLGFVKAISEHEGISQRELAEGLHVKPPTVGGGQTSGKGRCGVPQTGSEGPSDQPAVSAGKRKKDCRGNALEYPTK